MPTLTRHSKGAKDLFNVHLLILTPILKKAKIYKGVTLPKIPSKNIHTITHILTILSDNFMAAPLLFDIKNLSTENASMKHLIDMFSMLGETLVTHDVDKTLKRSAGITYKEVSLTFADSQTVTFSIKQTGDIWKVKINNKQIALTNQDAHKPEAVVQEIAKKIKAGRSAYQKANAAKTKASDVVAAAKQSGLKNTQKIRVAALKEQVIALDNSIAETQKLKAELEAELA